MTAKTLVGVVTVDDRGRIHLKRYVAQPMPERWMVYRSDDGKTIVLDAVEE